MNAYLCDAVRTPIGRYGGALATVRADDLAAAPIRALLERAPQLDPAAVDEVLFGCANQAGEDGWNVARIAALLAGLPPSVPGCTVNRLCASGLEAVGQAARAIRLGEMEVAVAGGVESMSRAPLVLAKAQRPFDRAVELHDTTLGWRFVNRLLEAQYGVDSMAETAENVAEQFAVSRADQDAFALRSQQRAAAALAAGRFDEELMAVTIPQRGGEATVVARDEHPRPETSLEGLAALPTPFRVGGSVTAGNASGVNDGSCALLLASERAAQRWGLTPRARVVGMAAAGVEPRIMGVGPVAATRALLRRVGLTLEQMDVIELNEAFAAQALAALRALDLDDDDPRVNPNGGAIALGHPLGMSGARLVAAALYQLQRSGGRRALCALCVGVGQGAAMLIERV